ncbi:hypothetical protein [Actinomadura parmotrematis]|uniref:Uncharacterized protein n=1 Tax=Actinomadura parmotrematis TaxID=2864039 RepID=A0ABS7FUT0_9ACTN|nr:hypothetical protein [Actinomadura parmotrematis]MBW8484081.1 hypothetical protein [Actinomadura parmotrematis]
MGDAPDAVTDPAGERPASPFADSPPWWAAEPAAELVGAGTGPLPVAAAPDRPAAPPFVHDVPVQAAPADAPPAPADAPPAPPAAPRSRRPFVLGAAAALAVAAAAGAAVLVADRSPEPLRIAIPASAGGLSRSAAAPSASAAYPFVAGRAADLGLPVRSAVYTGAGARSVLFLGGTGEIDDPAALLARLRPATFISAHAVQPGAGGGKAACGRFAVLAEIHQYCAWATADTFGVLASDVPVAPTATGDLSPVLRTLRPALEHRG